MSEKRFPSNDEIAKLREKGDVAISAYVCRITAGLCSLLFIFNSQITERFREILSVSELGDNSLYAGLLFFLKLGVSALAIYICTYIILTLLQSRFYFRLNRVFKRKVSFFEVSRVCSLMRGSVLAAVFGIVSFLIVVLFILREFFISLVGLINRASFVQMIDVIASSCYKFSVILAVLLLLSVFIAILYSKLSFLLRHRVNVTKR